MKTIIITKGIEYRWLRDIFPGRHPLLVTLCNKPFIEFLIDFCILAGSTGIRIISDEVMSDLEKHCENGSRWGVEISYANLLPTDNVQKAIEKNSRFCSNERVMVINGLLFIHYDKRSDYRSFFASLPVGEVLECSNGNISLTGAASGAEHQEGAPPLSLPVVDGIDKYYRLAAGILHERLTHYVLPGYNNEPDCFIGRNVVLQKGVSVIKPVIIGNNVQILAGSIIGPGAIIGSNVIIDRESRVSESIVMDNTFIGEQLDVDRKIAEGSLLIDPESGCSLTMEDPHLLSGIKQPATTGSALQWLAHRMAAAWMIMILLVPYLVIKPFLEWSGLWKTKKIVYHSVIPGENVSLTFTSIEKKSVLGAIALFLSLDRFTWLFKVLNGHFALIGCRPVRTDQTIQAANNNLGLYRPGVFSYSEAEKWPENDIESDIVDHYYAVHSNFIKDISMTQKALFNRINQENSI
ncbi:MAG: NDP-sugar synthase [Chlorobiaceae bacterium]